VNVNFLTVNRHNVTERSHLETHGCPSILPRYIHINNHTTTSGASIVKERSLAGTLLTSLVISKSALGCSRTLLIQERSR